MSNALEQLEAHLSTVDPNHAEAEAVEFLAGKDASFLSQLTVNAGDRHSENTGEEHIIGDLEDGLDIALALLTPEQLREYAREILRRNTELENVIDAAGEDFGPDPE